MNFSNFWLLQVFNYFYFVLNSQSIYPFDYPYEIQWSLAITRQLVVGGDHTLQMKCVIAARGPVRISFPASTLPTRRRRNQHLRYANNIYRIIQRWALVNINEGRIFHGPNSGVLLRLIWLPRVSDTSIRPDGVLLVLNREFKNIFSMLFSFLAMIALPCCHSILSIFGVQKASFYLGARGG